MAIKKHDTKGWKKYYAAKEKEKGLNLLLQKAIRVDKAEANKSALDLGCGLGNDSIQLLKRNYEVLALDAQQQAITFLRKSVPVRYRKRISGRVTRFELIRRHDLPLLTLINASFSIFFCPPSSFDRLWRNLHSRLLPGGVFCGQFLGLRDSWAKKAGMTAVSERKLRTMFSDFEVLELEENENDEPTITGIPKHWHYFTILARKNRA